MSITTKREHEDFWAKVRERDNAAEYDASGKRVVTERRCLDCGTTNQVSDSGTCPRCV